MAQRNTGARKGMRKAALALALLLVLACLGGEMVFASDKIMDSSPAENLQVNVLYSDGSKMKEKTYSISDMKSLGLNEATYCLSLIHI